MKISASDVDKILKQFKYNLIMDKMHHDDELKKYEKLEKYFDRKKYLTIKSKNDIVIGRIYNINSNGNLSLNKIELSERELDIILAFFKFFRIPNALKIAKKISELSHIKLTNINVDIIRNNVYKQEID